MFPKHSSLPLWFHQVLSGSLRQYLSLGARGIRVGGCTYSLNTLSQTSDSDLIPTLSRLNSSFGPQRFFVSMSAGCSSVLMNFVLMTSRSSCCRM